MIEVSTIESDDEVTYIIGITATKKDWQRCEKFMGDYVKRIRREWELPAKPHEHVTRFEFLRGALTLYRENRPRNEWDHKESSCAYEEHKEVRAWDENWTSTRPKQNYPGRVSPKNRNGNG